MRAALAAAVALASAGPALADDLGAPAGRHVRVLLHEQIASVRVARDGRPAQQISSASGTVRVDGRPVGPVWRARGEQLLVDGLRVRGEVEVARQGSGLRVVNRLPLEDYVAGTLGREVYHGWQPEALKAQAVATRTYALHQARARARGAFDVEADTKAQVYGGIDAESPAIHAAVLATQGEWLAWQGQPILAVFHATSGGQTASAEEVWGRPVPYLRSLPVADEELSPDAYWRTTVSRTTLGRALVPLGIQVGPIRELRVAERSASGRARRVQVIGRDGNANVEARALRTRLGAEVIRSTLFEIRTTPEGFLFRGSGHGHGVGMSQWGAESMAQRGLGYRAILALFYPGTRLRQGLP